MAENAKHDNYLEGIVEKVMDAQSGVSKAGNNWKKQPFLLKYMDGEYEHLAYFEIFGEKQCENNPVMVGQHVTVFFNVEAREFNGKYYTDIRAWKVQQMEQEQAQSEIEQEIRAKAANPVNAPTYHDDPAVDDDPFA